MLSRALVIALCCAFATSLTPLSAAGDDNDCALYLNGPGRTSAYDYSLNLLKGNFGYEGQHTCITYDAVNQAYLEARNRIVVAHPKGDWKAEDFASVGELLLDISINLARIYGLTYEEIEKGLPLIDTSRTLIREVCPPIFSHVECRAGKYRRLDGLCTNLKHPTWGATMAPFQRLIGPLFSDGINAPRISHTGRDLPLSRVVSRTMHPDEGFHDHAGTVMVIAWGQFMDHDYTLTGTPLDPVNRNDPEECCKRPPHLKHPYCNEIRVPDDDYFYRLFGVKCIDFVRGFPSPRPGCRLGSRVPFNTLTGVIDGNTVYGVTEKFSRKLRTGYGGLLRMNPVFKDYGLKDLLPLKLDIPDEGCTRPNKNMYCFEAGEIRVNEQLVLTVMHTLMAREHNRVAKGLAEVNPHWDDETLFQEARRINIAEIQHITYNEFLPILLGKDVMEKFGLVLQKDGYWDGYDPDVNTDVIDAFAAAAYRFGHSLLPTAVERWSKAHKFIASKRLSDLIRRPYDLYRAGVLDEYVMGLMNQVAQAMDDSITQEVTNHLFKKVGARFGMDLVSFNMQRGREFGLPGYMEFRKFCGLSGANSFQDLFGTMSNDTVQKYETIFEHPIDVDLWSGGVSERPLPGSMLGPTFACIIATQFSYSRRGDRFWYELPNQPSSFTPEQLVEVKKARLARVICDNTDIIDTVQLYPMVLPDHELNPRVPCRSGIIPSMDFTKWAEPAPFHGAAKQFVTVAFTSTETDKSKGKNITAQSTEECECVDTIHSNDAPQQVSHTKINLTIAFNSSPKVISNVTSEDCTDNAIITTTENAEYLEKDIKANDTVLKYVYKKKDNINLIEKIQGHPKNSLIRRKRSGNNSNVTKDTKPHESQDAPLIVNYQTSHDPLYSEPLINHNAGNIIKNSNLADFNIETLHENIATPQTNANIRNNNSNINKYKDESVENNSEENLKPYKNSDESAERYEKNEKISKDRRKYENSEESEEEIAGNKNIKIQKPTYKDERQPYRENYESHKLRNNKENFDKTKEHDKSTSYESEESSVPQNNKSFYERGSQESDESKERNYSKNNKFTDNKEQLQRSVSDEFDSTKSNEKESNESKDTDYIEEKENYSGRTRLSHKNEDTKGSLENSELLNSNKNEYSDEIRESSENSNESNENKNKINEPGNYHQNKLVNFENKSISPSIQDVDLGDFSYERIQVNEKGQVEPARDTHENYNEDNTSREGTLPTTSRPEPSKSSEEKEQYLSSENDRPRIESSEDDKQPININDGEIKPVVEITGEINSDEFSESEIVKDTEDKSLETVLGIKENIDNEQNEKIIVQNENEDKIGVKQQFERIPLNYKHDESKQEKGKEEANKENSKTTAETDKGHKIVQNEGTLDTLSPKDENYDEHLKFKFDDVTVKLPEIKLPEDILAYTYEDSPYSKKNKNVHKPRFYEYNDDRDESEKQNNKKSDDDDYDYQDYYGKYKEKDEYKKKKDEEDDEEDDDEYVDLYEKFVRERFGKRGSFQQRSEKLKDATKIPDNDKLYETLHEVLKKTQKVQKEAEKSGDPKAGYMWTLEYGQNL